MKNKRLLILLSGICLILVLVALPFMAACAKPAPAPVPAPAPPSGEVHVLIGGSGIGGAMYPISCAMMTIVNEKVEGVRATAIAQGSLANFKQVLDNKMFMNLFNSGFAASAYTGGFERFPDPNPQLRICGSGWGSYNYFITLDPNIKTLYDIKGKKVAMGGPGSTDISYCEEVLNIIGLERDVDYEGVLLDGHEAGDALMDGRVDVKHTSGGLMCPSVVEVDVAKTTYFIPWPEDKMDEIVDTMLKLGLGKTAAVIPQEYYKGLNEDYPTIASRACWFAHEAADEEIMYKVVKGIWENVDYIALVHSSGKDFDLEHVKVDYGVPMHPGALRYYKEIGLLTEDPFKG